MSYLQERKRCIECQAEIPWRRSQHSAFGREVLTCGKVCERKRKTRLQRFRRALQRGEATLT